MTKATKHQMPITQAEYKVYEQRVNEAAGTDIRLLEVNWAAAVADEDFATATRLEQHVRGCRKVAGY